MLTLGLHIGLLHRETDFAHRMHSNFDSAAALLDDGTVLAACRESTLAGVARDKRFPAQAIRFCLGSAGRMLDDIDAIAIDQDEATLDAIALQRALDDAREPLLSGRAWIARLFAAHLDADVGTRLNFVDHTTAHLRAAFVGSGFDRAASLCLDGVGCGALAVIAEQDTAGVRVLKRIAPNCSLADLIDMAGDVCGFGSVKAADLGALAVGGDPARYHNVLRRMHVLASGGELYLRERAERLAMLREAGVMQSLAVADATERAAIQRDMAAAVQVAIGDLVSHVLREARQLSTCRDLCITGELANDPYLVGRALHTETFEHFWVAPVADDAGNAIGAATHISAAKARDFMGAQARWGRDFASDDVERQLAVWRDFVVAERVSDPAAVLARHLAEGRTVAWLQRGSEWNTRALSSCAVLSDPRLEGDGSHEALACVRRASIAEHFDCSDGARLPRYANYCLTPRNGASIIPAAVRNVDGSVALHPVDADDAYLHGALEVFERLTDVPCVRGRTFVGLGGMPVGTFDDAIACLLARPIDALVVGDHLVRRCTPSGPVDGGLRDLVPRLARGRELVRAISAGEGAEYAIARHHETDVGGNGAPTSMPISRAAFDLLRRHDADTPLRDAFAPQPGEAATFDALFEEVVAGWRAGFVELRPRGSTVAEP